jgi:hypothetical protein
MQHLTPEDIARCADEAPTAGEAAHLGACRRCNEELECMRAQIRLLSELPELTAPEGHLPRLRAQLAAEGLMMRDRGHSARSSRRMLRIAAAVALFLAGGASGAVLRGTPAGMYAGSDSATTGSPAALVTVGNAATADEATDQLASAEQLYLAALTRYAELTQGDEPVDPVTRLAALEGIVLTAQAALRESPADPVINSYLLTAVGQREAMLRQISNTRGETWF